MNMVTRGRGGYSYEYGYYYTDRERGRHLGRTDVGVAAGKSTPDAADGDSLDLLTPESTPGDPYQPVHAPDSGRPTPKPSPASMADAAPRSSTTSSTDDTITSELPTVPRREGRGAAQHTSQPVEAVSPADPTLELSEPFRQGQQRGGAGDAGWSRAINGEQQPAAWSPPDAESYGANRTSNGSGNGATGETAGDAGTRSTDEATAYRPS